MARITLDELNYCIAKGECLDCHAASIVKAAAGLQKRGKLRVPSCRAHFNAYRSKINQRDLVKAQRRADAKQKAGLCIQSGCHNKMIPQELLPPWIRERTCGMHGGFKAFRVNRTALVPFITQHYFTHEQRRSASAQNIIYKPGEAFAFFAVKMPGYYLTKIFSAKDLLQRYRQIQQN